MNVVLPKQAQKNIAIEMDFLRRNIDLAFLHPVLLNGPAHHRNLELVFETK